MIRSRVSANQVLCFHMCPAMADQLSFRTHHPHRRWPSQRPRDSPRGARQPARVLARDPLLLKYFAGVSNADGKLIVRVQANPVDNEAERKLAR